MKKLFFVIYDRERAANTFILHYSRERQTRVIAYGIAERHSCQIKEGNAVKITENRYLFSEMC